LLSKSPEAFRLFQKAQNKKTLAYLLILPGSAMVGYEIGRYTARGKIGSTRQLVAGAGLAAVGLLVSLGLNERYEEVAKRFNEKSEAVSAQKISLVATAEGLGVRIHF